MDGIDFSGTKKMKFRYKVIVYPIAFFIWTFNNFYNGVVVIAEKILGNKQARNHEN